MKQTVIRVQWPQPAGLAVADWLCYLEEVTTLDFGQLPETPVTDISAVSFSQAVHAWKETALAGQDLFSIVLPAELALYDRVQLPARSKRQAMQALPFVVEEQLADDIENVHLAVGERQADGCWPVLAIERARIQQCHDVLSEQGAFPEQMTLDAEMLPATTGELYLILHERRVLVRSSTVVTAFDLDEASMLLQMLEGGDAFKAVHIFFEAGNEQQQLLAEQWSTEFAALGESAVNVKPFTCSLSALLLGQSGSQRINLLQGQFALRKPSKGVPWWQVAAAAALVAFVMQTSLQVSSGWFFNQQSQVMILAAEKQYRELFPDARKVSNPRKRLESRIAGGGDQTGRDSFAGLFGAAVMSLRSVAADGSMVIEQLRYEGKRGELELELKVRSIQQLDQFKQALVKAGLQADIASANEGEAGVIGRVKVRSGA